MTSLDWMPPILNEKPPNECRSCRSIRGTKSRNPLYRLDIAVVGRVDPDKDLILHEEATRYAEKARCWPAKSALSPIGVFYVFGTNEPRDREYLKLLLGEQVEAKLDQLKQYEYVRWQEGKPELEIGKA